MHLIWEKWPDAPKDKFTRHIRWLKGSGMTIEKIHAEFEVSDKGVGPQGKFVLRTIRINSATLCPFLVFCVSV